MFLNKLDILKKTGELLSLGTEFSSIQRGYKPEYDSRGTVRVLRSVNIRNLEFTDVRKEYIDERYYLKNIKGHVYKDDIIITCTGLGTLGRTSIWPNNDKAFNVPENSILRGSKTADPYLIAVFLSSKFGVSQLIQNQRGSSGQLHLYPVDIKRILIPKFLLFHSHEISPKIRKAFELKDQSHTLYSQATQLLERELGVIVVTDSDKKNKYLSSYRELVNSKRIDAEYYDNNLKALILRILEVNPTTIGRNFYIGNGYPWDSLKFLNDNTGEPVVRIRDIRPGFIDNECLTSLQNDYAEKVGFPKAEAGDIVIGMDGIKYFYSSIVDSPCLVNQRVCHLKPKSTSSISSEYLSFIINSLIGQAQLLRDMTVATTVGHITNMNVSKMIIPLFSNSFQNEITDLIRNSIHAKKHSKLLLQQAKSEVETLIEQAAQKA